MPAVSPRALVPLGAMLTACSLVVSLDGLSEGPSRASTDADPGEADAPRTDACAPPGDLSYNDMTSPSFWSSYDLSAQKPPSFVGGAFDGRYVYLVPSRAESSYSGRVFRFDTRAPFQDGASWSSFDLTALNLLARGFSGATFDGRYLYLVPGIHNDGVFGGPGVLARYDTLASFDASASWSTVDVSALLKEPAAFGFAGATFDGRHIYLVPTNYTGQNHVVVRYDTRSSFGMAASWASYDPTAGLPDQAFLGAVFDGRYVYLAPSAQAARVTRYDTQASFDGASSWSTFDTRTKGADLNGALGGAGFDGRYVTFPGAHAGAGGTSPQFDTRGSFSDGSAWAVYDVTSLNANAKGFLGTAFDGRYVYFIPNATQVAGVYSPGSVIVRHDTEFDFGAGGWTSFDTGALVPSARGFQGAVYDGRFLYLVPQSGVVARFDTKSRPSMPCLPAFFGSFF
jgi:hypothetical protein